MAASSSHSPLQLHSVLQLSSTDVPWHDIFLSHSGAQKPFAKALYDRLQTRYSTFFDIVRHSLPLGEEFPHHIFYAARTCRLAVVVLSEEYVQGKWPMKELCAFVEASPPPKILPLFFKSSPNDLKKNMDRWHSTWQKFAEENPSRIDSSKWKEAFKKLLSCNGITLEPCEEESAYIERVFSDICGTLPSSLRHDFSGFQGMVRRSQIVLDKFEALDNDQSKVCVLGMYGLPGSGKTTLSRYLCDCLFTKFKGKAIHLELSMNAEDEELLIKFKDLLKQLTNFNNKMDLTRVSSILQAYQLLNNTDVKNSQVFLIVDNIVSERSRRFVEELFVRLDVAAGSKILLVARSVDVLHSFLQKDGMHQNTHYVYGCMSVPCLTTLEAVQVLLRYKDSVGLKSSHAQEAALTSSHRNIMEEVVKDSGFPGECGGTIYLPLVLERMGVELREGKLDVESWSKTMKKLCKEDALKQIVEKGFRSLTKRCQTVFLDVVLFILSVRFLDYERRTVDAICSHLSILHVCEPERIELEMKELQRHGFLTIQWEDPLVPIKVHDLYLEFAASIEEAASYYCNSGLWASKIRHHHQHINVAGSTEPWLRTAVLELYAQHFEISPNFSRAKAISFRNCMSLKTLGGFANLTCVMSLEIHNCPNLRWLESPANYNWPHSHIQMFQWTNRRSLYNLQLQTVEDSSFKKCRKKDNISSVPVHHLLVLMKGLVILRLENTGITQGLDMSSVPQLRVLEVSERHMKYLRVCNLPNLERFVFLGDGTQLSNLSDTYNYGTCMYVSYKEKPIVMGKEFMAGCPRLQEVTLRCLAFKDELQDSITLASSHLKYIRMECLSNVTKLPKLSTAATESLRLLSLVNCQELRSLNFGCVYRNLIGLVLQDCENVTEVSGLDKLPNLQTLVIRRCPKLKRVSSLCYLRSLQKFVVDQISRRLQRFFLPDFENMTQASGDSDNVASLVNGVIVGQYIASDAIKCKLINLQREGLTCHDLINTICKNGSNLVELAVHISKSLSQYSLKPFELGNARVETLRLQKLVTLKILKGIGQFSSITCLLLNKLPHLSSLQGIGSLKCLRHLFLWNCRSVEEIFSLYTLRRLEELSFRNCKKLKKVEGLEILGWLQDVEFYRCENLSNLPLDLKWWNCRITRLDVRGSKFAGVETLVAWAEDMEVPEVLRRASLKALRWELSKSAANNQMHTEMQKKIATILLKSGDASACSSENDTDHDGDYDDENEDEDEEEINDDFDKVEEIDDDSNEEEGSSDDNSGSEEKFSGSNKA